MSVILNQAALDFLLQNPAGPVGLNLRRRAEVITGNYEAVIGVIWENQDEGLRPQADYDIAVGDEGLRAIIGIPFHGRISEYMGRKLESERDRVVPSLMQGWESV
jgi:hypothetical protein